jgi:hypothetical protein
MAYDSTLADRLRDALVDVTAHEKKMFGGIAFMVRGNMCVGVVGDDLCARVGVDAYPDLLAKPGARPMDFTKRPMKGWLFVDPSGFESDAALRGWVEACKAFNTTLPAK